MNKKTIKIITVITIIALIVLATTSVFAAEGKVITPADITGTPPAGSGIQDFGNQIVGVLQAVGVIVSVAILVVLGIKYMLGSAEEKAEYKKTMIPYIIGAALVFAASMIAGIVVNFFAAA